ncbi:MAG: MarR family transcriptional regulator [Oscillospiraceae bacterium]
MTIANAVNQFYFDMNLNELQLMAKSKVFPAITYNSLMYLDIIAYKENCTVSFLADAFNVAKSAVTLKINELIRQGLVDKTQSETDKRVHYLTVKPEVLSEYKIYDRALYKAEKIIGTKYSGKEMETFCDMLGLISKCYVEESENEQCSV